MQTSFHEHLYWNLLSKLNLKREQKKYFSDYIMEKFSRYKVFKVLPIDKPSIAAIVHKEDNRKDIDGKYCTLAH